MVAYTPPTGASDPNQSYVDKNLAGGKQGSPIPGGVIEGLQRELVAVEVEAGLVPTNTDWAQVMRAVRSGGLMTYADQGTQNAILLASRNLKHTAYVPGQVLCIKLASSITGATTINLDGLGVLSAVYPGGTPLQRYDFLANDLLVGRINAAGTAFIVLSPISQPIIDTAVVKSVHGTGADFPDLNAAIAWANRRRIAATGSLTFQLAAGVNTARYIYNQSISFFHPDGARIVIQGQPITAALPAGSSLQVNGSSAANRLADTTQNLATLRNVFATEIFFTGGASIKGQGAIGGIAGLLITSDGTGADGIAWQSGTLPLTNVGVFGAGGCGVQVNNATLLLSGTCYGIGNTQAGFQAAAGGFILTTLNAVMVGLSNATLGFGVFGGVIASTALGGLATLHARGNGSDGVQASGGRVTASAASVSSSNGGHGWNFTANANGYLLGAAAAGNAGCGVIAQFSASVNAQNTTGTGNGTYAYLATDGGYISRSGGAVAGASGTSPAVGASGNSNGYIS
ncbi:hypothetical protein [Methylobacterium sp. E-066]|uniref:hypothetical protein n=1 Tax=Methylobacterium sp. E-066 TaxID=2836584 RepID=UPI001FB9435B|nr:hypothetical protein [Methylobacterium sp. E-066]MCJ2141863.1 hypothetical protein [Methylobacterium sp. E-066]